MIIDAKTASGNFVYINIDKIVVITVIDNKPAVKLVGGDIVHVDEPVGDFVFRLESQRVSEFKKQAEPVRVIPPMLPSPS